MALPEPGRLAEVTVVIVTYNSAAALPACVHGLAAAGVRFIIVDNHSRDGSAALAAELLPQAEILRLEENRGFGRACNLALQRLRTPFALLLNPDCQISAPSIGALLSAAARYPTAALLAPRLYDAPGRLGCCYRPAFFKPQPRRQHEPQGDLCSEFLTGAVLLLRMAQLRDVGFFDPWFFLYGEDDDLCLRVRSRGYSLVLAHAASALHPPKTSSPNSPEINRRRGFCLAASKLYLVHKHLGCRAWRRQRLRTLLGGVGGWLVAVLMQDRRRRQFAAGRIAAARLTPALVAARECPAGG
ncbi:MAG: glycosyltransferase family 2 protein [Gammaproteobacteria bacterium]|nr:glycosyltransferase family 2 protein [Gammaproteobacteria bacterium]